MICNTSNWLKKSSYGRVGGKENFFHCDRCDMCLGIQLKDSHKVSLLWHSVKPLPSNTSMQFLLTVLYTFSMVLRVRICWTIKLHVELLEFAIISFILMAVMFDSVDWYSCEKWDAYKIILILIIIIIITTLFIWRLYSLLKALHNHTKSYIIDKNFQIYNHILQYDT